MRAPGRRVRADAEVIEGVALDSLIIVMRNADENAEIGAALEIEHEARVLDRFPRRLEQKSVLRIDIRRFTRRDTEKLRIELID